MNPQADVLVIDSSGSRAVSRDALPPGLREIVAKVEAQADGAGEEKRVLTERELRETLLRAAKDRIDGYRVAPDESDLLDHDGAMATHVLYSLLLGRSVEDTEADIYARASVLGCECSNAVEETRATEKTDLIPDDGVVEVAVRFASSRIAYTGQIAAAWARDGFVTYDVTRGLYDLVTLTDCDPNAAAASPTQRWAVPAFALRFPGPAYPRVRDAGQGEYEIRGAIVSQYRVPPTRAASAIMRENMIAATDDLTPGERDRFGDIVNAIAPAAEAALVGDGYGLAISFCGYNLKQKRPVGSTLENGFLSSRTATEAPETVADAIRAWAKRAADDSGFPEENEPAYRHLLNVVYGVGLWLTHSGDAGVPKRARPVRIYGTKRAWTPRAFVLGRGVKEAL